MMRDNRLSTVRSLKMASTEMGSVAEMMHPKRSAMSTGKPINQCTRYPVTRAARSTPTLASNNRGTELRSRRQREAGRAGAKNERRKKQYQNHIGREPIGTVTGLKGRQDRKLNDSQEQAAQDQGYRVGNPQAFRQHRDDRSNDKQPNQEFYARGWSHLRHASLSICSNSLTKTWRVGTGKGRSDLWTQKIDEQTSSNYEADTATNDIAPDCIH
jgi:hypothetical protein